MTKTKTEVAKAIAKFVVGTSVGFTTGNIIKNNTTASKRRHKAEVFIGGVVVGTMAAEAAENWTDRKIDDIVAGWQKLKSDIKINQN